MDIVVWLLADELPEEGQHEREARVTLATGLKKAADEIKQRRKTSQFHKDSWLAAEAEAKRLREKNKQHLKLKWMVGYPTKFWAEEWFIAETVYGDRVVLKALPEHYTYDFTTADGTYMKKENVKKWMQFPDSEFCEPETLGEEE